MATRFWVGGTGTWDAVTTTHWAATTGGAGGVSVPGSADTVTFDGASGGGTVTVNFGGTITVQSITCGAFTGTLDFSANNNSVTLSSTTSFSGTGTGVRTLNLGNGTWTLNATANSNVWNMTTTTNLTFNANSSTIVINGSSASNPRVFTGGGLTYSTLQISATGGGLVHITGANIFSALTVSGPSAIQLPAPSTTQTITTLTLSGTSGSEIYLFTDTPDSAATLSVASNAPTMAWVGFRDIAGSGGATFTATNSFDLGHNTGITITAPATGGGGISRARAAAGF